MFKFICDERNGQLLCVRLQAAQQIEINLHIFSIGAGHVIVQKKIGDQRMTAVRIFTQNKTVHDFAPFYSLPADRRISATLGYLYCSTLPDKKKQAFLLKGHSLRAGTTQLLPCLNRLRMINVETENVDNVDNFVEKYYLQP